MRQLFVVAVASSLWAGVALAQEQQSFKALMGKGYDIKGVTFTKGTSTDNQEVFVITLQKDRSVAVCYIAAVNWITLANASLEDGKRCDVR
jgi:hypothetical protein